MSVTWKEVKTLPELIEKCTKYFREDASPYAPVTASLCPEDNSNDDVFCDLLSNGLIPVQASGCSTEWRTARNNERDRVGFRQKAFLHVMLQPEYLYTANSITSECRRRARYLVSDIVPSTQHPFACEIPVRQIWRESAVGWMDIRTEEKRRLWLDYGMLPSTITQFPTEWSWYHTSRNFLEQTYHFIIADSGWPETGSISTLFQDVQTGLKRSHPKYSHQ